MIIVVQKKKKHEKINSPAQYKCVGSGKLERNLPSLELQGPVQEKKLILSIIETKSLVLLQNKMQSSIPLLTPQEK